MEPPATGRSMRLALVAFALLALLGVVAFASRSGLGHTAQAAPTPGYVSYAFTAFLIVFVLMIPVAAYGFIMQARKGEVARKSYRQRTLESIGMLLCFGVLAFVVLYLKRHNHHLTLPHLKTPNAAKGALRKNGHGHRAAVEPHFEYTVLWLALAALAVGGGWFYYVWRRRTKRTAAPLELEQTVAEDFASSIGEAIDDLESEPDARRAVIAAYARMETVLARSGLKRRPSETPVEYLRRILLGLTSRGDSVTRLTSLFEQAKFSRHPIDAAMKQDAIGALREIRDDLQGAQA
ncbi:MAG: hypothetical protein QOH16_2567 [Gaiellaceae bacterium]|jgi:hypothetical protein|nr:hypothetical protein [Gaiellaceae bacterium]